METSLSEFKLVYLERVLEFLWGQWSALGVAGNVGTKAKWAVDPEALLLHTCTMGRYDARLFDEVLDWMNVNGSLVNVQRLRAILRKERFGGQRVLSAIAALPRKGEKTLKWKKLSKSTQVAKQRESLFFHRNTRAMKPFGPINQHFEKFGLLRGKLKLRGYTRPVPMAGSATLLLRLRAFLGLSARCEILLYLLSHSNGHPSEIARQACYSQKAIQDALVEMAKSGLVFIQSDGNTKRYWLQKTAWYEFLSIDKPILQWASWPPLLRAIEIVWAKLSEAKLESLKPVLQAMEFRLLLKEIKPKIEKAGFAHALSNEMQYPGEQYAQVFLDDMTRLLDLLS